MFIFNGFASTLLLVAVAVLARVAALLIHRLHTSPIAGFPGPTLAAATHWYEAYYDLFSKGGGQWTFQIRRLHQKYGPIVRINPDELHIDDPEYYDTVFCNSYAHRPIDKIERFRYRFGIPEATVQSASAEDHRRRRAAIAPCFSRMRLRSRNNELQAIIDHVSFRLSEEFSASGKPVNLTHMWAAMASDVIMKLAFARSTTYVAASNFQSPFAEATSKMVHFAHLTTHFGFITTAMNWLPGRLLCYLIPPFRPIVQFREEMGHQIRQVLDGKNSDVKTTSHLTIFDDALLADLPPQDLTLARLTQEAVGVNGGAVETTSWVLTVASFYILYDSNIKSCLVDELRQSIPDPKKIPAWDQLEKLPYLSAIIMEALRLGFGSVQRLPRVSRSAALDYKGWVIPPNTPVGMDAYHCHMNETIFPEPLMFRPERWLGNPTGPDGLRPLSNYMVSFSRGARNCLGINLAWMELYVGLATVFRRHDLALFDTSTEDVEFVIDMVRPMPKRDSKGVRVLVL